MACLWFAVDGYGNVTVIRELYESGLIASEAAAKIRAASPEEVAATYAPPDLANRQKDTGRSMWEIFESEGIRLTRADANRIQGWMQVKEYLSPHTEPSLTVFSTCTNLIRCLGALVHDPDIPGDCMKTPHELTHLPDALRYFLRGRASAARKPGEAVRDDPHKALLARIKPKNRKGRFN